MKNGSKRVLLTGATGLIGPDILRLLLSAGYEVTVISRRHAVQKHERLSWIRGNLANEADELLERLPPMDYVVHAAAMVSDDGTPAAMRRLLTTNSVFSEQLFAWCGAQKVARVVYLSSLSLLSRPLQAPVTEGHAVGPAAPYAVSKYLGEIALLRHASESGFTPIILRITSPVTGELGRMHDTVVTRWLRAALNGNPIVVFGNGERCQDFVSSEDVAGAVGRALTAERGEGVYNIGCGEAVSMMTVAHCISSFRGTRIEHQDPDDVADEKWLVSIDKARAELGYAPVYKGVTPVRCLAEQVLA